MWIVLFAAALTQIIEYYNLISVLFYFVEEK